MARTSAHHELNKWLDQHGYRHAHAPSPKTTQPPYGVPVRPAHAVRKGGVAEAFAAIRATGASVKRVDGELQVNVPGGTEATVYFTDDAEDALATARAMMEHHKRHHARMVKAPTGRKVIGTKERNHHITTHGRQTLKASQFALPPGESEKRRGIAGRLPIDTLKRARNALARAAQMKKRGHITAAQLATVRRKVHAAWPSIDVSS
jgi:hypothetical protein